MILQKYDSYKDSGEEYFGEIPQEWEIKLLKHIFYINAGGDLKKDFFSWEKDFQHPYPIYTNITNDYEAYAYTSKPFFKGNTITVTGRGDVGYAIYRDEPYDAIIRLIVLNPRIKINCKYFTYQINNVLTFNVNQTAIKQLSAQQISPYRVIFPPFSKQTAISNFLDKKTSQIDSKIILLQEKITSYEDLKKSIINETVCRGLNKNVELQNSEIEWIGNIPKHWKVERGKNKFFYNKCINKGLVSKNVLSLTYGGVINKDFNTTAGLNPDSYETYQFVNKDDLIFKLIDLENIKTSRVGIVHENGIMSSAYIRLNPKRNIHTRYYYYLYFFYYRINLFNYLGGGVRSTLGYSSLLEIPIISPPSKEEQIAIANYLEEKTTKIDNIISKIKDQINSLKEFRKTLINDVVTGKVRALE